jgi:uncharacterized membrane protein YuzA (DUF378 family)
MTEYSIAALLFIMLLMSSALGLFVQGRLAERHRSRDTVDSIRLVISILVTLTALVLGLLTSSVKTAFDDFGGRLRSYGANIIALDERLREYGDAAKPVRDLLRTYTAAAIADTWPEEPKPAGSYPVHLKSFAPGKIEAEELSALLLRIDNAIRRLEPADKFQQQLADQLETRMTQTLELRWRLIETAQSTVSWPLLCLMSSWLAMIFAVFGLSSPRNKVIYATILLCALSISAAVFMILELDSPLSGWIVVSSEPLRNALQHIDAP